MLRFYIIILSNLDVIFRIGFKVSHEVIGELGTIHLQLCNLMLDPQPRISLYWVSYLIKVNHFFFLPVNRWKGLISTRFIIMILYKISLIFINLIWYFFHSVEFDMSQRKPRVPSLYSLKFISTIF